MIENLKIALKRQKKLIFIFLLTILLPSLSLSILGVRAIRNEKFRQAKQAENELRGIAELLKTRVRSPFKEIESTLLKLSPSQCFLEKDYPAIRDFVSHQLADYPLIEQIFVVYKNEEPQFPLFEPAPTESLALSPPPLKEAQLEILKTAEGCEFKDKNYKQAILLYQKLFSFLTDKNSKAQMLAHTARCFQKLKDYRRSLQYWFQICKEYPESLSPSLLPLELIARLQIISCYKNMGDFENGLKTSLAFYGDLLLKPWRLNESQFRTYSSIAGEEIKNILSENRKGISQETYDQEFERLKSRHQKRMEQWQVVHDLQKGIIPELQSQLMMSKTPETHSSNFSKTVDGKAYLISTVAIPDKDNIYILGLLGINIQNDYLKNTLLSGIIKETKLSQNTDLVISDHFGNVMLGRKNPLSEVPTLTMFFEDNFPPWKIDLFRYKTESSGLLDLIKSFYFWTILTLIIILTFGTFLIVRTIAHEMEILKIKSDFVSSVSHEFKTPLTSIRALIERLQEGKVKDPEKTDQYYSIISQDADRLTRLVRNILDFSKIEEGKREYEFVETDVAQLVAQQVEDFRKDVIQKGVNIEANILEGIPPLNLDRDAVSQALNNLLDNAAKFSPDKKEISVAVTCDQESVRIDVKDKGIGIGSDESGKIFDKFCQGRNARRLSAKGTGLGLTLVKHTVEAHGGRISVESQIGEGSTFSLIFPIKRMGK